jgi:hypothetical protein
MSSTFSCEQQYQLSTQTHLGLTGCLTLFPELGLGPIQAPLVGGRLPRCNNSVDRQHS